MQHRYFAASNSAEGFKNYYPEVFERADRLYIIKGGPGTGKSSFMKRFADRAVASGREVEYYYCSSDPTSLDGVIVFGKDTSVGMLDGTAPHVFEPSYPGVREEIVNLGQFWDPELLKKQKNEIYALSYKKGAAYKRAYSYLRSCGNLRAVTYSLLEKALLEKKLCLAAERTVHTLSLGEGKAKIIPSLRTAVGMTGSVCLDSFEKNADETVFVGELYGVGQLFLDRLLACLREYDVTVRVSYDPISPSHIDGLFIEEIRMAFVLSKKMSEDDGGAKTVNSKRFVEGNAMRSIRGELRYAARLFGECLDGAVHELSKAKIYHFVLEDIYKQAMDFHSLSTFSSEFIGEVERRSFLNG